MFMPRASSSLCLTLHDVSGARNYGVEKVVECGVGLRVAVRRDKMERCMMCRWRGPYFCQMLYPYDVLECLHLKGVYYYSHCCFLAPAYLHSTSFCGMELAHAILSSTVLGGDWGRVAKT